MDLVQLEVEANPLGPPVRSEISSVEVLAHVEELVGVVHIVRLVVVVSPVALLVRSEIT